MSEEFISEIICEKIKIKTIELDCLCGRKLEAWELEVWGGFVYIFHFYTFQFFKLCEYVTKKLGFSDVILLNKIEQKLIYKNSLIT